MTPLALQNIAAYSLQVALLVIAGALAPALVRIRQPRAMLAWRQALLAACLALPLVQTWHAGGVPPGAVLLSGVTAATDAARSARMPRVPMERAVIALIAAGAMVRLLWLAGGSFRLRRSALDAAPLADIPEDAAAIAARLRVAPRFLVSPDVDGPVTLGVFRPVILLPERFERMDAEMQTAICCHELLHVRRRDWVTTLLEEFVRCLFWFHPAVRWLLGRIRLNREQVVDREAVRLTGARRPYLEALLEIAAERSPAAVPAPSFLRKRHLAERVAQLVKEISMSKKRLAINIALISVCALFAALIAVRAFPLMAQGPIRVDDTTTKPVLIYKVEPKYTEQAKNGSPRESDKTPGFQAIFNTRRTARNRRLVTATRLAFGAGWRSGKLLG